MSNVRRQGQGKGVLPAKAAGSREKLSLTTLGVDSMPVPIPAPSLLVDAWHPKGGTEGPSRNALRTLPLSEQKSLRVMGTLARPCESWGSPFALLLEGATADPLPPPPLPALDFQDVPFFYSQGWRSMF